MITAEFFTAVTGAEPPASFAATTARVVARLEDALGIGIEHRARTEWVYVGVDGTSFPTATPVTSAGGEDDGYSHDDVCVFLGRRAHPARERLTYTGGWLAQGANPADGTPVPHALAEAIAWAVHTLEYPDPDRGAIPEDVQSMSVAGEFSVNRFSEAGIRTGADGVTMPSSLSSIADLGGRCARLAAGFRRIPVGL